MAFTISSREIPTEIVQKIAYAIRCAADVTIRLGDPEWCELVFATFSNRLSESVETIHIGAMPARAKILGEVVRIHLHLNDFMSIAVIRNAIRMAIEPLLVRGRQLMVHDSLEGLVVILALDDRKIYGIHGVPATTAAG